MSATAIKWLNSLLSIPSGNAGAILQFLCLKHCEDAETLFISKKTIQDRFRIKNEETVDKALKELRAEGLIDWETKKTFVNGSFIRVNHYRFLWNPEVNNNAPHTPNISGYTKKIGVPLEKEGNHTPKKSGYPYPQEIGVNKTINKTNKQTKDILVGNVTNSASDPRVNFGTRVESQEDIPWDESEIPKIEPELFELETPKEETPKPKKKAKAEDFPLWEIVDKFNEICVSFPKVRLLSDKRKTSLKSRIKDLKKLNPEIQTNEQIVAFFADLFRKIESIDWWKGKDGGWQLDFNFIMNPEKFVRLCEGSYFNKNNFNQPNGNNNGKSNQTWGCAYDPNRSDDEVLGASELGYKIVNGAIKF